MSSLVVHKGGCHCGKVRYEVKAPTILDCLECNCSICVKKQNMTFIVPNKHFKLLYGQEELAVYTFNTHVAKHTFCRHCGVQSFYHPRSNPDGVGVMPHCLDPGTVEGMKIEKFDGHNWESTMLEEGDAISSRSKICNFLK